MTEETATTETAEIIQNQRLSYRTMAALNGSDSENLACSLLKIKKLNELIDGVLGDSLIEIKSCQKTIIDNSHSNRSRSGRFILTEEQHNLLTAENGFYLFLITEAREPTNPLEPIKLYKGFILPAKQIKISIKGIRGITWKTILDISKL